MLLIGNNTLSLCGASVCAIVAKHLNESMGYAYSKEQQIQVSSVAVKDGEYSFSLTLVNKSDGTPA